MFSRALIHRLSYRHGLPFIASAVLAVVTTARIRGARFHATSIWTFAILATLSTAFALLCGGRFRTFFIAIAVTPPFLFVSWWFLHQRSAMFYFPIKAFVEFSLYFVAAPILLVWIAATLLNRREQGA
jgi:Zn-dependent protease with chaperone function